MYITTQKDFNIFKKYILDYQNILELNNWDIYITHEDLKNKALEGRTYADVNNHCAHIQFNKKIIYKPDLKLLTLHEILHIFLAGTKYLAECRYVTDSEIDQCHEEEVTKLTNILIKKFKRR